MPSPSPPAPSINIQFAGVYGFLYILWQYGASGRAVVVTIIVALMVAAAFVVANLTQVIAILAAAHE